MYKKICSRFVSLMLSVSMVCGAMQLSGCASETKKEPITLNINSMLANYSGMQTGWFADIIKEKLNIKLNILPQGKTGEETKLESGDLGDIVVWGNDGDRYAAAVNGGLLYDLEKGKLLEKEGSYIKKHMQAALKKNRKLTSTITQGQRDTLYGFGNSVATSKKDHDPHIYTWDIRWDLYKELGYPEVKNLQDLEKVLKQMCQLCPKNDADQQTYAFSLWPDWDDAMVMYVKATATAYHGYDEFGIGLYDPDTGTFHGALEENGVYLEALRFYHKLYMDNLLDSDSRTQVYEEATAKVRNGTVMCSIFNYAGQMLYNTPAHLESGKAMLSLRPEDACPLGYGATIEGKERIWSIGAKTKHPKECMQLLNWLCTPEGRLTTEYGPEGLCWEYDSDKKTKLTELGKKCRKNSKEKLGHDYKGTFYDGKLRIGNETWAIDATNPESDGETYNADNWESASEDAVSTPERDWRSFTGAINSNNYIDSGKHNIAVATDYHMSAQSEDMKRSWNKVTGIIKDSSWRAIFATDEGTYNRIVYQMIKDCKAQGYEDCVKWCQAEAEKRFEAESATGK